MGPGPDSDRLFIYLEGLHYQAVQILRSARAAEEGILPFSGTSYPLTIAPPLSINPPYEIDSKGLKVSFFSREAR